VLIFYESPQRLAGTLAEMAEHFADRQVLVVRELTKLFEEAWRGPVTEVAAQLAEREIKGECTLVLSCPAKAREENVDLAEKLLAAARKTDLTGRRLAELVATELNMPRRQAYQAYLELKEQGRLP
jgi:16S rRNA (cytidine1402-2'-O)-methyltransferase